MIDEEQHLAELSYDVVSLVVRLTGAVIYFNSQTESYGRLYAVLQFKPCYVPQSSFETNIFYQFEGWMMV